MNTRLTALIWGIFLFLTAFSVHTNSNVEPMQIGTVTFADNHRINVEIADTETLRRSGLMHRKQLPKDHGMLFVYPDQAIRGVWMKNTLIPLDILFLSEKGKVISMLRNLPPCKQELCPIFVSTYKAQYMLELNAGFIDEHQMKTGQDLLLDYQHNTQ